MKYEPHPENLEDIKLSPDLIELQEKIAQNVHEVWAEGRIKQGWKYGETVDSDEKTTPWLIPYDMLPESEKEYDRMTAMQTLKYIIKQGYQIIRSDNQ